MRVNKDTTFLPLQRKKKNLTRFSLLQRKNKKAPLLLLKKAHQSFFTRTTFGMCYTSPAARGMGCLIRALSHCFNSCIDITQASHTPLETWSTPAPAQGPLSQHPLTRRGEKALAKGRSSLCPAGEGWQDQTQPLGWVSQAVPVLLS